MDFSGLFSYGNNNNSSSSMSMYSLLADYSSITSGTYRKLVKAYYAEDSGKSTSSSKSSTEATEAKKDLVSIQSKADALKKSINALMDNGKDSLFNLVEVKDEETGKTSMQYDTDKIYDAVKKLVDDYNSLVGQVGKSDNSSILRKGVTMVGDMVGYAQSLKKIGITVNEDNTMTLDEEKFKKANMKDVQNMFSGNISIGSKLFQKASDIYNLAKNAASSDSLYNRKASYVDTNAGTFYNGLF